MSFQGENSFFHFFIDLERQNQFNESVVDRVKQVVMVYVLTAYTLIISMTLRM